MKNTFDYRQKRCNNRIRNDIKNNKEKDICVYNKSIDISKRNVKTRVRKK